MGLYMGLLHDQPFASLIPLFGLATDNGARTWNARSHGFKQPMAAISDLFARQLLATALEVPITGGAAVPGR